MYVLWLLLLILNVFTHPNSQLEYDNERSGDFEPLKYLPLNKVAVLGLVTTKNDKVLPTVFSQCSTYQIT